MDRVGEAVRAVGGEGVSVDGPGAQYCPFRSGSVWSGEVLSIDVF